MLALSIVACGKKGPPLAPFSDLPKAVGDLSVKRIGSDVAFQFTVPSTNIDNLGPANLERVDIYISTRQLFQPAEFIKAGTVVGSVKVRRPAVASENGAPPPAPEEGVDQATVATLVIPLAGLPPLLELTPTEPDESELDPDNTPLFSDGGPLASPRLWPIPARRFVAVGVNRRGREGEPSPIVQVSLAEAPVPPANICAMYTETAMTVGWGAPSVPLRRPIQEATAQSGGLTSRSLVPFAGSGGYNVYVAPPATDTTEQPAAGPLPKPLNSTPLTEPVFTESSFEFGVERCYVVRTQESLGDIVLESAASTPLCVTPVDTFAPAAPRNLRAVGTEGAISLIWDPNTEGDLGGYHVLRGEAPGETLQALTTAPISETTYRDTTVRSGVTYVYAVVAVDKADNISARSEPQEERGR